MEKHRLKLVYLVISGFTLSFVLGLTLFFPLFDNKSGLDVVTDFFSNDEKVLKEVGDNPPPTPEPYIVENFIPPGNSFGIGKTNFTYVNWSFFWQKFRANSRWDMEGWHPSLEQWVDNYQGTDLDNWLDISRIRSGDNSSEKITLNFTSPFTTKYRFTFGIDAQVLDYVNKTDRMEYVLTYPINGTDDNYTVFFNWSDLIPMLDNDTIRVNHGIKNIGGRDVFWFRIITNVDLQEGNSYELDPTFGNTDTGTNQQSIEGLIVGGLFTMGSANGQVDSITAYHDDTGSFGEKKCAIYDTDRNLVGGKTGATSTRGSPTWTTFDYGVGDKPSLSANTDYYIVIWGESDGDSHYLMYKTDAGSDVKRNIENYDTNFPDPLDAWGSDTNGKACIYATYTITNTAPSASNPNPTDGETNTTISEKYNVTAWDIDGDSLTVDFYISTDNSNWVHIQTNSSHTANTSCEVDLSGHIDYNDVYYMKTTVNDGTENISFYSSFETTPYRSSFFNDTFPSGTWIKDSNGMVYQDSWYNNSLASGGNLYYDDFENNDWGNYTPGCSGSCAGADHYIDATGYLFDSYTAQIKDEAYFNLSSSFDASGYDTICADYWFMFKSYNGVEDWDTQYYNKTAGDWVTVKTHDFGDYDNVEDYHEVVWFNTSDGLDLSDSFNIRFMTKSNVGNGDYLYFDNIYINGTTSGSGGSQNISSEEIFHVGGTNWDKFYADVNDTTHCSFSLRDYDTDYNIITGLVGNGDDISSVTNNSFYIYGNFSEGLVAMDSWNVSWSTTPLGAYWKTIINTINGVYSNTSKWYTVIDTINGVYTNVSKWHVVIDTINGVYSNTSKWYTVIDTINGVYTNVSKWHTVIDTINGSYSNYTNDPPFFTNQYPVNNSVGVSIHPGDFNITIEDPEGDAMDYSYTLIIEGCGQGGSSAMSVNNGTYTILYNDDFCSPLAYGTTYTWWANLTDGTNWANETFSFTTEIVNWKIIINTINGVYFNTSKWKEIDGTINGSYSNISKWHTVIDTINGSYSNVSTGVIRWQIIINTINGIYSNKTDWNIISNNINGVYSNTSKWHVVIDTINGVYTNVSKWYTVIDTINGTYTNISIPGWKTIINTINGVYTNTSAWVVLSNDINGSYSNSTVKWTDIDNTINGVYRNYSAWVVLSNDINGSYINSTSFISITISNIYPNNASTIIISDLTYMKPVISFQINHTGGDPMTYKIYSGNNYSQINTLLITSHNNLNGTYNYTYTNAKTYKTYYIKIIANITGKTRNTSFHFLLAPRYGRMIDNNSTPGFETISLLFGIMIAIILLKKNKNRR